MGHVAKQRLAAMTALKTLYYRVFTSFLHRGVNERMRRPFSYGQGWLRAAGRGGHREGTVEAGPVAAK